MKFYIIPGFGEKKADYSWLIDFASKHYDVEFLDWQINQDSFSNFINQPLEPSSVILGFSMGGLIAYKQQTEMDLGIYCSPTTVLEGERNEHYQHMVDNYGPKNAELLQSMKYGEPRSKNYHILFGELERDVYSERFSEAVYISNTGHEFTQEYKETIYKIVREHISNQTLIHLSSN